MKILREPEVIERTGLSRSTVWRLEKNGHFPKRRRISPGSVGWLSREIDEWIEDRAVVTSPEAT